MITGDHSRLAIVGPVCSLIDPSPQEADFDRAQRLAFGRHDFIRIEASDKMNDPAFGSLSGHQDFPAVAALQGQFFVVETQPAFLFFLAVAGHAMFFQQRLNVLFEIDRDGGGGRQRGVVRSGRSGGTGPSGLVEQSDDGQQDHGVSIAV